ncbi:hypothetical protein BD410DRAFT_797706 [Rickenella mellea]|uniref:Uncharacterized protein n=1 Tax=Rickenella mellea TaxID=50990 RepID=A0A4R5XFA7_9AGAM|nr:hypothetical protein BD410DRAFT_797706 [Rickenella mellea]
MSYPYNVAATLNSSSSNKRIRLSVEGYGMQASSKRTWDDLDDVRQAATFVGSSSSKRVRLSEEAYGEPTQDAPSASYSSSDTGSSQCQQRNSKSKGKGKAREDAWQETGDAQIAPERSWHYYCVPISSTPVHITTHHYTTHYEHRHLANAKATHSRQCDTRATSIIMCTMQQDDTTGAHLAHLVPYHRSTYHTSRTYVTTPTDLITLTTCGPTHTRVPVNALCPNARLYPTSPRYQAASRHTTATWRPALETVTCHWLELRGNIRPARFQTVRSGINASMDSTVVVKSVIKSSREYDDIAPISEDNAVWTHLQPVVDLLAECSTKPFHFDLNRWVNAGVLVEAGNLVNNTVAEYYLRVIKFSDSTALCNAICRYISAYPADMSVAVPWLALLGHPMDDIKSVVRASLVSRGYVLAATQLLSLLDEDDLQSMNLGIENDAAVYLLYTGYSIAAGPEERLAEDMDDDCRRFPNFFGILGSDVIVSTYRFAALNWPAPLLFSHRTDPIIGYIESICIDSLCIATLNSRRGGIPDSEYLPPPDIVAVIAQTLEYCDPIRFTAEDPQMTQSIRALEDDEFNALKCSIKKKEFKAISPRAFENMKRMSADVVRKVNGAVPSVDLMKDIPGEGHSGQTGGTYADNAGEALRLHRHILTLINDKIPASGTLNDTIIAQHIGPFVDFWRLLVGKGFIHWSAAFLSRYLCVLRPLIIVAFSNPINKMLRNATRSILTPITRPPRAAKKQVRFASPLYEIRHFTCDPPVHVKQDPLPLEPHESCTRRSLMFRLTHREAILEEMGEEVTAIGGNALIEGLGVGTPTRHLAIIHGNHLVEVRPWDSEETVLVLLKKFKHEHENSWWYWCQKVWSGFVWTWVRKLPLVRRSVAAGEKMGFHGNIWARFGTSRLLSVSDKVLLSSAGPSTEGAWDILQL